MAGAARLNDNILGSGPEHMGHDPAHGTVTITGTITGNVSSNVFINGLPAVTVGSTTTEADSCCGEANSGGVISGGSSKVFINGKPAARIGDLVNTHVGSGLIISGSGNVIFN